MAITKRQLYIGVTWECMYVTAPILIYVLSFATYVLVEPDQLDLPTAFTVMTIVHILNEPLNELSAQIG